MKYLFDTDTIIYYLRGKKKLSKRVLKGNISISIVTLGELLCGAYKSHNKENSLEIVDEFLNEFEVEVINIHKDILHIFAQIKISLEIKGQRLEDFDLLIAATALFYNIPLLTNNQKHFQRIPNLKLSHN